jgi:hypothetical protein
MILALKILGAIAALALGIWLGLPGRSRQRAEDLEETMEHGGWGRRHREKRSLSPLAWIQRNPRVEGTRARHMRGFRVESPDDE